MRVGAQRLHSSVAMSTLRTLALTAVVWSCAGASPASAWGCDGHQAIALAAELMLPSATVARINAVLAASPVDQGLRRFCVPRPQSALADAATWADDLRAVDPASGDWHFINFPRAAGAPSAYQPFCARGNCIVDAIVAQYRVFRMTSEPARKADALRFLTHLVGDLHQPLHAITNGDRGGNCVAVSDGTGPPQEDERHNWRPNL